MKGKPWFSMLMEESVSAKFFVFLFYVVSIGYDLIDFYVLPGKESNRDYGLWTTGLGIWAYVIEFALLPLALLYFKRNNPYPVKYIYFLVYTSVNLVNELLIYWGTDRPYRSGNVAELLLVLFSPIFVNRRFFFIVSIGTMLKYAIIGLLIRSGNVILPIVLLFIFSLIALIILSRFHHYVTALKRTYAQQIEGIVKGIIAVLGIEDAYTCGHSERVSIYSVMMAEKMGLFSTTDVDTLKNACLLHDIGKVNIPDSILNKTGPLNAEEFDIIKQHPVIGSEVVKAVEGLEDCYEVVRYHHERWDGKGYPDRLAGREIPLFARIVAIADAFDAMTSTRSYRSALSASAAYGRITEGAGSQFDPELVAVFKEVFASISKALNEYNGIDLVEKDLESGKQVII